jgi:hypothetical protein
MIRTIDEQLKRAASVLVDQASAMATAIKAIPSLSQRLPIQPDRRRRRPRRTAQSSSSLSDTGFPGGRRGGMLLLPGFPGARFSRTAA